MSIQTMISSVLIFAGAVFFWVAAIGIIRFPDFYTRLHSAGIGDTFGAMLMTAGIMVHNGWSLLTIKVLIVFIVYLVTNPLGTNLIIMEAIHAKDYQGYTRRKVIDVIRDAIDGEDEDMNEEMEEKEVEEDAGTNTGSTAVTGVDIDHSGSDLR